MNSHYTDGTNVVRGENMRGKDLFVRETESIKDTLKKLDKTAEKVLLVADEEGRLLGAITDGDIRRCILQGSDLNHDISRIYNKNPIYVKNNEFTKERVRQIFIKNKIELIPIVNEREIIVDFITWDQLFADEIFHPRTNNKIDIPVVIMAGGKGTRLDPFTKILPKPLIPIGDKPIVEIVIDEFRKQGAKNYYLTLNHRGEMVESYFNGIAKEYSLKFIKENISGGTAASLKLVEEEIDDLFFVSNCDVIVKAHFAEVIAFHKEQHALLTIMSSIQHYKIPYGVINYKEGGHVGSVIEKPEYTFTVNTGIYLLSKESLRYIPKDCFFDMTDLIKVLIKNKRNVVMYPVNESDYIDIGQWEEYKKAIEKINTFTK